METVEVVIRINKNTFDAVNELSKFVDGNHIINGYQMKGNSTVGSMITALAKGTVLPKGHGRLIDADKIVYHRCPDNVLDCPQSYDFTCQHCDFGISTKFRTDAIPTIIEADKEAEE